MLWDPNGFPFGTEMTPLTTAPASDSIPIDLPSTVTKSLRNSFDLFRKDLNALPEDAFDRSFGGKTRTVADIVHEVNLVQDHIGLTIRGEELFDWPEGWITAPENQRTKEAVIAAFEKSSALILATIEGLSFGDLERKIINEHGEQNVFDLCRQMTVHLWYHSGQLNFIQTILGDDVWHWV